MEQKRGRLRTEQGGYLSNQLADLLEELLEKAYKSAGGSMTARVEEESLEVRRTSAGDSRTDELLAIAGAMLPGVVCIGSLLLQLSPLVTGAATLVSCAGGLLAIRKMKKAESTEKALSAIPEVTLIPDDEKRRQAIDDSLQEAARILRYVSRYEAEWDKGYDITVDRRFGEWAQRFLVQTADSDDRAMLRLHESLLNHLADMKIHVYDALVLNDDGTLNVPYQDYLIDAREGETYREVVQPALYSDRGLLARGKVR